MRPMVVNVAYSMWSVGRTDMNDQDNGFSQSLAYKVHSDKFHRIQIGIFYFFKIHYLSKYHSTKPMFQATTP